MLHWTTFQKKNVIKGLSNTEDRGMLWNSLPNDIKASESKAIWLVDRQTVDYILLYFIFVHIFSVVVQYLLL